MNYDLPENFDREPTIPVYEGPLKLYTDAISNEGWLSVVIEGHGYRVERSVPSNEFAREGFSFVEFVRRNFSDTFCISELDNLLQEALHRHVAAPKVDPTINQLRDAIFKPFANMIAEHITQALFNSKANNINIKLPDDFEPAIVGEWKLGMLPDEQASSDNFVAEPASALTTVSSTVNAKFSKDTVESVIGKEAVEQAAADLGNGGTTPTKSVNEVRDDLGLEPIHEQEPEILESWYADENPYDAIWRILSKSGKTFQFPAQMADAVKAYNGNISKPESVSRVGIMDSGTEFEPIQAEGRFRAVFAPTSNCSATGVVTDTFEGRDGTMVIEKQPDGTSTVVINGDIFKFATGVVTPRNPDSMVNVLMDIIPAIYEATGWESKGGGGRPNIAKASFYKDGKRMDVTVEYVEGEGE